MVTITEVLIRHLKTKFNIELNEQQREAITHKDGPAIVLAVPGAGKTTTMVVRIYMLIKVYGIDPRNILTMTFSKASAKDMKSRFEKLFGMSNTEGVVFSTIHSFALSVIKSYERKIGSRFTIIEGNSGGEGTSKITILKRLFKEINNEYITEDQLEQLCNDIGMVNNKMIKAREFSRYNFSIMRFAEIYEKYTVYKTKNNLIDFDDMLARAYNILLANREIANFYCNQYKYVLIDEGQDTSKVQHELVKLLVRPSNNLFLVADDDQSIYGFRGAEPSELMEFEKNYKGAKKYFIEKNYRSMKSIVNTANEFIKINKTRETKNMTTDIKENGQIKLKALKNEEEQINYVLELINKNEAGKNIAILYRNNVSAITLIDELSRRGILFNIKDTKMYALKHWLLLDILAFMTFSLDNRDLSAFEKIYYKMDAYLPKTILNYLKQKHGQGELILDMLIEYPYLDEDQLLKLYEVKSKFEFLNGLKPIDAIDYILSEFNYNRYLKKYCKENNISENGTDELVFIIKAIAKHTATQVQFICRITELENVVSEAILKNNGTVMLSTIHGSKGLEFDKVVLMDLVEGKIPSSESLKRYEEEKDETLLNEEARVLYVGITRARSELTLITVDFKNNKRVSTSRFFGRVSEIIYPSEHTKENKTELNREHKKSKGNYVFPIGTRVNHGHYGRGEVIRADNNEVSIKFDTNIVKSFPSSSLSKYIFLDNSKNK